MQSSISWTTGSPESQGGSEDGRDNQLWERVLKSHWSVNTGCQPWCSGPEEDSWDPTFPPYYFLLLGWRRQGRKLKYNSFPCAILHSSSSETPPPQDPSWPSVDPQQTLSNLNLWPKEGNHWSMTILNYLSESPQNSIFLITFHRYVALYLFNLYCYLFHHFQFFRSTPILTYFLVLTI